MECFSYKGGCGVCEHAHIEAFKKELAWVIDKWLRVNSNKCYYITKELKNKTVLNLKQYCMLYYVTLSM